MAPKKSTIVLNVEQFIRDVEERPAIWNRNFHCNKAFLEQMWDELSAAHKLPKVVLKAKWKGLRDNFRVEYKRIPRAENGEFLVEPATFESKWIHYYALLFLTDHMRHRLPKNEQDQSFFFAQQSQDCEKTVVEPDLTNGLIRRMQDSDEDYDEDEMVDDDDELSNLQAASQTNTNNSSTTTALTTTNNIPKSAEATSAAAAAAVAAAFMDSHHTPASAVALTTFTSALQPPLLSTRTRTPPAAHTNSLPTTTTTAAVAAATAAASTFFKSEESRAASLMSSVAANSFLFNAAAVAAAAAAASSSAELDSEVQDLSIKAKYVPSSQQLLTSNNNSLCAKNYNNQTGSNSANGLLFPFNSRSSVGATNLASRRNVERSLSSSCSSPSSSSSPPPSLPPPPSSSLPFAPPATTATLPLSLAYGGMPSIAGLSCTPAVSNGGMNGVSSSTAPPSTPPRNASRLSASALQLLPTTSSASVSPHISSKQHQLYHHINGGAIDGGGGRSAFGDLCSAADALLSPWMPELLCHVPSSSY